MQGQCLRSYSGHARDFGGYDLQSHRLTFAQPGSFELLHYSVRSCGSKDKELFGSTLRCVISCITQLCLLQSRTSLAFAEFAFLIPILRWAFLPGASILIQSICHICANSSNYADRLEENRDVGISGNNYATSEYAYHPNR